MPVSSNALDDALAAAEGTGNAVAIERCAHAVLKVDAGHRGALTALAQVRLLNGEHEGALAVLRQVRDADPADAEARFALAAALTAAGRNPEAEAELAESLQRSPGRPESWLLLGQVRERLGNDIGALHAQFQAVTRAQRQHLWISEQTTPRRLRDAIVHAIERIRVGRPEVLRHSYEGLRAQFGRDELRRVDHALAVHLKEMADAPPSAHQRPRFFYFPGLPAGPYHDPYLHPWAPTLRDAYAEIRNDACRVLAEDGAYASYFSARARTKDYLRGHGTKPAWDAFFFYRHGARSDEAHARCTETSRILESIELCHIEGEAPEICFSLLAPHTDILPHHGVTNVRLVMHLPLVVPQGCALNVFGGGEHHWREGELMLFDDTYRHEAWNRSGQLRLVLLMDCWNPHLSPPERAAVRQLIEAISGYGQSARAAAGA